MTDYSIMRAKDLKDLCKTRSLLYSGTKAKLVERLQKADLPPVPECSPLSIAETKRIVDILRPIIETIGPKLFMAHSILKREFGAGPGGMGTATTEERIWTTQFRHEGITGEIDCTQADVGLICDDGVKPVSIKTLSRIGPLAVNWGKNKTKIAFRYIAPIMIIYNASDKKFTSGVYIIDPEWCQTNITLTSNNKSDYIISIADVVKMMKHAVASDMYIKVIPLEDKKTHCVYRDPDTGDVLVLTKLTPSEIAGRSA